MKTHDTALVDGRIVLVKGGRNSILANPVTGHDVCRTYHGDSADVEAAVIASRTASDAWSQTDTTTRHKVLEALAAEIDERSEEVAAAISAEVGTPEKIARAVQVGLPINVLRGFTTELDSALADETVGHSTVQYRPIGVVAAITPWNYPLHQAMAKIGAALAAGCTLVVKPSDMTPRTNALMMEILANTTPPGTVNVVPGDARTGKTLSVHADIDAVSFTGPAGFGRFPEAAGFVDLPVCADRPLAGALASA